MMYDFKSNNMEKIRDMMDVIPHRFFTNVPYGNKSWGIDVSTEMLFIKFDVETSIIRDLIISRSFLKVMV